MNPRDQLQSMLSNFINDKPEQASLDLHAYLASKMKDVAGLTPQAGVVDDFDAADDETDPE